MKIVYIKFQDLGIQSKLFVKITKTIEGVEWERMIEMEGVKASEIWNSWGTDNDAEILKQLIEK